MRVPEKTSESKLVRFVSRRRAFVMGATLNLFISWESATGHYSIEDD